MVCLCFNQPNDVRWSRNCENSHYAVSSMLMVQKLPSIFHTCLFREFEIPVLCNSEFRRGNYKTRPYIEPLRFTALLHYRLLSKSAVGCDSKTDGPSEHAVVLFISGARDRSPAGIPKGIG